jgi:hypothetical protein
MLQPLPAFVKGQTSQPEVPIESPGSQLFSEILQSLPVDERPNFPIEANTLQGRFASLLNENPWMGESSNPSLYVDIVRFDNAVSLNQTGNNAGDIFAQCVGIITENEDGVPYSVEGYESLKVAHENGLHMEILDMYLMRSIANNDVSGLSSMLEQLSEASGNEEFTRAFLLRYFGEDSVSSEANETLYRDYLISGLDADQQGILLDTIDNNLTAVDIEQRITSFEEILEATHEEAAQRELIQTTHSDVDTDVSRRLYGLREWSKAKRSTLEITEE